MYNSTNEYQVAILVNGRPIPEVNYQGKTYVEGRKNSQYSLQIRNNSHRRILVIPSVDGLNVLNGDSCGINSPGYVVDPRSTIDIPGWKVAGTQEAGRFVFKPQGARYEEDETYAESSGQNPANQGMIGFMIFPEKEIVFGGPGAPDPWNTNPWKPHPFGPTILSNRASTRSKGVGSRSYSSNTTASTGEIHDGQASMDCWSEEDNGLGTGWGDAVDFQTQSVSFVRADPVNPDATFVYHYDTIRNLRRIGVPVDQFYGRTSSSYEANPFPASPHVAGGCKPPSGWRKKKRRGGGR